MNKKQELIDKIHQLDTLWLDYLRAEQLLFIFCKEVKGNDNIGKTASDWRYVTEESLKDQLYKSVKG